MQFGMFETLSSGIVDAFPGSLSKRKTLVTAALSVGMFLLGLPFTTNVSLITALHSLHIDLKNQGMYLCDQIWLLVPSDCSDETIVRL